jgi:hypothetical protein
MSFSKTISLNSHTSSAHQFTTTLNKTLSIPPNCEIALTSAHVDGYKTVLVPILENNYLDISGIWIKQSNNSKFYINQVSNSLIRIKFIISGNTHDLPYDQDTKTITWDFYNITGTVNSTNNSISWSNGSTWNFQPVYNYTDGNWTNGYIFTIQTLSSVYIDFGSGPVKYDFVDNDPYVLNNGADTWTYNSSTNSFLSTTYGNVSSSVALSILQDAGVIIDNHVYDFSSGNLWTGTNLATFEFLNQTATTLQLKNTNNPTLYDLDLVKPNIYRQHTPLNGITYEYRYDVVQNKFLRSGGFEFTPSNNLTVLGSNDNAILSNFNICIDNLPISNLVSSSDPTKNFELKKIYTFNSAIRDNPDEIISPPELIYIPLQNTETLLLNSFDVSIRDNLDGDVIPESTLNNDTFLTIHIRSRQDYELNQLLKKLLHSNIQT